MSPNGRVIVYRLPADCKLSLELAEARNANDCEQPTEDQAT